VKAGLNVLATSEVFHSIDLYYRREREQRWSDLLQQLGQMFGTIEI
jgi:hypothetical protein